MWPAANCPDINPVDYRKGMIPERVYIEYESAIRTSCGSGLLLVESQHSVVDDAISQGKMAAADRRSGQIYRL